jgi:outer membrane protein
MNKQLSCAAAALLSLAAAGASAQSSTVYLGGAYIDVHSRAPALSGGPAVPAPGAQIEVDDASTVGFGYTYRFMPAWSVEAALGIPPRHKTYGRGFIEPFGQVSSRR